MATKTESERIMRFFKKKESWKRFLVKLSIVMVILTACVTYAAARYQIGYDFQEISSIPGKRLYIIDKWDKELAKGNRYAYYSKKLEPLFEDGSIMVKILSAVPGDEVEVTRSYQVMINGEPTPYKGLAQAKRIGQVENNFVGKGTLHDGEFWFMGTHRLSFDSRYYGAVGIDQILGRAYPIL